MSLLSLSEHKKNRGARALDLLPRLEGRVLREGLALDQLVALSKQTVCHFLHLSSLATREGLKDDRFEGERRCGTARASNGHISSLSAGYEPHALPGIFVGLRAHTPQSIHLSCRADSVNREAA